MRTKQPIPAQFENAPELLPGLDWHYQTFLELSHDRPVGFGFGAIPSSSIRSFANDEGLSWDEAYELNFLIRKMDVVFMAHYAEKMKKESKK